MRFLADMGVSLRVVDWPRAGGHDLVHLRQQGLQTLPNGDILEKAACEQRIVLTFDLGFGEILAASGKQIVSCGRAPIGLARVYSSRRPLGSDSPNTSFCSLASRAPPSRISSTRCSGAS